MSSEYIKLSQPEVVYGQNNFLKAQLDVLDITRHYLTYQKLRKEEFLLKIELRNKIGHVQNNLLAMDKILPKTYPVESEKKKKIALETDSKEVVSLKQEIELIKQKLARLR